LWRTPALLDLGLHRPWQAREISGVVAALKALAAIAADMTGGIGGPGEDPTHERVAIRRNILDAIAVALDGAQDRDHARGGVEADAVSDPAVLVRVVREHQGDTPLRRGQSPETYPVARELGHERDAVGDRRV